MNVCAQEAYLVAAHAFIQCAGTATNEKGKRTYYRNAADCYGMHGESVWKVTLAFLDANEYTLAAEHSIAKQGCSIVSFKSFRATEMK